MSTLFSILISITIIPLLIIITPLSFFIYFFNYSEIPNYEKTLSLRIYKYIHDKAYTQTRDIVDFLERNYPDKPE